MRERGMGMSDPPRTVTLSSGSGVRERGICGRGTGRVCECNLRRCMLLGGVMDVASSLRGTSGCRMVIDIGSADICDGESMRADGGEQSLKEAWSVSADGVPLLVCGLDDLPL